MAITTRQTTGTGVTNKGAPLTNAELDTNFIELVAEDARLDDNIIYNATNTNNVAGVWEASIPDVTSYTDGLMIAFYPNKIDGVSGGTTFEVNSLGAKTVTRPDGNTTAITTHYDGTNLIFLRYVAADDYFIVHANYNTTDDYRIRYEHNVTANNSAGSGTAWYGYELLMEGIDGKFYPVTEGGSSGNTNAVSTAELRVGGVMLIYSSSTNRNANANTGAYSLYEAVRLTAMEFWNNRDSGWATAFRPWYIVATINANGNFVLDNTSFTSFLTQDLPTSDDGKYYIHGGLMLDTYDDYRLQVNHPIYVYKNGAVREWSGYANNADLLDGNEATAFATAAQGSTADSALQNVSEDTSPQLGGNLDTNGYGITLDDGNHNVTENHILLGNNGDLDIYHSSLGSVIGNYTSDLFITNVANDADVRISAKKSGSTGAKVAFLADGSTGESILYHDGDQKIATKSTGIQTTGTVSVNGAYTLPTSDGTNGQVLTTDGSGAVTFADASGGGSSLTIKDEGTSLSTAATTINFTGSGVTATGTGAEKTVNIPSVAKYTEFDLAPGATSVTLSLSGDSDVQKVEFRLAAKTTSSGPNNVTFTVKTSGGTNHRWDIQGMKMYNYTDTMTGLHVDGTTDLYSFLPYYNDFSAPTVFTFYKSEGDRWTCEATIGSGTGTTGTSYVLHCRTDFGYSYSDIGSFVITTGSSYNWLSFDGTIVEYFK